MCAHIIQQTGRDFRGRQMDDYMSHIDALTRIKQTLQSCLGRRMRFRTNLGRCRVLEKEGVLEELHPNLFVIRIEEDDCERRITYTYSDILTRIVQLTDPVTDTDFFSWLN
jgi:uncharacterized protein Veg